MMVHIIENTEQHLDYEEMLEKEYGHLKSGVSSAIGYSSVLAAANLNAKCILRPTVSGATARVVSNLRPRHTERENFKKNVHILGSQTAEVSGA